MSGADLLARLLTAYKFTLPLDHVRDDPSLPSLISLGIIEDRRSGATTLCDACDFPHSVTIGIDPITDKLGWRCPSAGFVEANTDQLKTVRLLPDRLASLLASTLECKRRNDEPLIKNLLWKVGYYEFSANDVNVYLASRIRDAEDAGAIAGALQAEPSLRNGLVITPDISGTAGLTIAECRFAEIGDVISIKSDVLSCNQSHIAALAGIVLKKRGGRPLHKGTDAAFSLIRSRLNNGEKAAGKRAEARAISDLLGDQSPKPTKLFEMISEVWDAQ